MGMHRMFSMLIGVVLVIIAAVILLKPENRKLKWPWAIGIVGIVGFIINLIGFILDRTVDVYEVTEQAYEFAARVEESLVSFQSALTILAILQGVILLAVAVVVLRKPENRGKKKP